MSPTLGALRAGLTRAGVELRRTLRRPQELGMAMGMAALSILVLALNGSEPLPGVTEEVGLTLAQFAAPGLLGLVIAFGGVLGAGQALSLDRQDGTLLRVKAVPHGTVAYLSGKLLAVSAEVLLAVALVLVPAAVFGWVTFDGVRAVASLTGVVILGLLATLPWGMAVGSLFRRPKAVTSVGTVPLIGLAAISGVLVPITLFADWVHALAQVFPVYWLGLGLRSALLPDVLAQAEIGGSWRPLPMIGVLGAWALVGLSVAQPLLRRVARDQSGARVQAGRDAALRHYG